MSKRQLKTRCDSEKLELFLQGTLSRPETEILELHLTECESCARQIQLAAQQDVSWHEAQSMLAADEYDNPQHISAISAMLSDDHSLMTKHQTAEVLCREIQGWLDPTDDPAMLGRFAGYEIIGIIGHGGMGIVLKGFESSLNRYVAIKILAPRLATNGTARKRFAREARAAAAVLHENVIAIHRVDEWHGLPFLVMPYIGGMSLQKRIDDEGPLSIEATLRVGMQIAAGLSAAHAQGLIHRDIKPANILLDRGVERVTITDFGLARAADDASMTRTGVIAGTPQYMSPEQAEAKAMDARSDLFSLGSVLYTMATGRPPFRGNGSVEVLKRIVNDNAQPMREIETAVPEWFERIVNKLHSKTPADRPSTAGEVAEQLELCLAHVQQPTLTPLPESVARVSVSHGSRSPVFKFIAAAAFAFFMVFAGVFIVLELNKGTLVIQSDVDDVPIRIMQGDKIVEQLIVKKSRQSVRIAAGQYVIDIEGQHDGLKVNNGVVSITRGDTSIVRVTEKANVLNEAKVAGDQRDSVDVGLAHGRFLGVVEANDELQTKPNAPVEPGALHARAFVEKEMIGLVRIGNPATIRIDALPAQIMTGKVTSVSYTANPPMRNGVPGAPFEAIISFDVAPKVLKPGMTGEVDIVDDSGRPTGPWPELEGTWKLVSISSTEKHLPPNSLMKRRAGTPPMIILGNRRIRTGQDSEQLLMEFVYDREAVPQTFDTFRTRNGKTFTSPYIVAIDADKLRLGSSMNGGNLRPTSFDAPRVWIEHYERVPSDATKVSDTLDPAGEDQVSDQSSREFEFSAPLGLRRLQAQLRNAQLRLQKAEEQYANGFSTQSVVEEARLQIQAIEAEMQRQSQFDAHYRWIGSGTDEQRESTAVQFRIQPEIRVSVLAWSPDAGTLAVGGDRGIVSLYNGQNGKYASTLKLLTDEELASLDAVNLSAYTEVGALAFSTDSTMLAVGNGLGQLKLFNVRTGELIRSFNDDRSKLAETENPEKLKSLARGMGSVGSLAFSPDGSLLATCGRSFADFSRFVDPAERGGLGERSTGPGRLKVWDVRTGMLKHDLVGHSDANMVAFSADGSLLASAGRWLDKSEAGDGVIVWNPQSGEKMRVLSQEANGGTHAVAFSPHGKKVVIGSRHFDNENNTSTTSIRLAYPLSGVTAWQQMVKGSAIPKEFSPDGKSVVVLCGGKSVQVTDAETGAVNNELQSADFPPESPLQGGRWFDVALSPDRTRLGIVGVDSKKQNLVVVIAMSAAAGKQLGTVLGRQIRDRDLNINVSDKDNVIHLLFEPLMEHYCKQQGIDREAELREKIKDEPARAAARTFVLRAELNRQLYDKYGGRVQLTAFGPFAVDAQRQWIDDRRKAGDFEITDPGFQAMLDQFLTVDEKGTLFASPSQIKEAFDPAITERFIENYSKIRADAFMNPALKLIGVVAGKPVYLSEQTLNDPELTVILHQSILPKLEDHYRKTHPEVNPTDAELDAVAADIVKGNLQTKTLYQEALEKLKKQIENLDPAADDYSEMQAQQRVLERKMKITENDGGRECAAFRAVPMKLQKHLYDNYGGGRALITPIGTDAFDAQRKWAEEREALGEFQIADPRLRETFYEYWTDGIERFGVRFIEDPDQAKARFLHF